VTKFIVSPSLSTSFFAQEIASGAQEITSGLHRRKHVYTGNNIRCTKEIRPGEQEISSGAQEIASGAQEITSSAQEVASVAQRRYQVHRR
jgi:X-X-X-Leu-X-X-Gly heptad repeat protein